MGIFRRRKTADTTDAPPTTGPVDIPDDIGQARALRAEATEEHRKTLLRGFDVSRLTSELAARRVLNHFGEDIMITFTRRTGG